jgi:hypothetical protein
MFLSTVRVRLIYSPFYKWLRPLRPLEGWIYGKLRAPPPLSSSQVEGSKFKVQGSNPKSKAE